jgi:hypothetical protein
MGCCHNVLELIFQAIRQGVLHGVCWHNVLELIFQAIRHGVLPQRVGINFPGNPTRSAGVLAQRAGINFPGNPTPTKHYPTKTQDKYNALE